MEMDCNLKKIGQYFQVPTVHFGEIVLKKKRMIIYFSPEKSFHIFLPLL